jgi:aspartate/glutamate racemase
MGAQLAGGMNQPCVGIVGGLGVEATIHYYGAITKACKEQGRGSWSTMPTWTVGWPSCVPAKSTNWRSTSPA